MYYKICWQKEEIKRNCQYKLGGLPSPHTCQTLFIESPHSHNLLPRKVSVVCSDRWLCDCSACIAVAAPFMSQKAAKCCNLVPKSARTARNSVQKRGFQLTVKASDPTGIMLSQTTFKSVAFSLIQHWTELFGKKKVLSDDEELFPTEGEEKSKPASFWKMKF